MVVPLRSQARLWLSLLHWAYYGLFPPLAAAFVRPSVSFADSSPYTGEPFWEVVRHRKQHCPRASFFPKGKGAHEARALWDGASPRAVRETGEAEVQ